MEIKFHDKSLLESHSNYSSAFTEYKSNLDKLSEDIKSLESFFSEQNINVSFDMEFSSFNWPGGTGQTTEFLSWDKYDDKFRLLYKTHNLDWDELPHHNLSSDELLSLGYKEATPLIQAKLQVRKKTKERLAEFYRKFAKEVSIEPIVIKEDEPSTNFPF